MRFAWISISILLADLLIKFTLHTLELGERSFRLGTLAIDLLGKGELTTTVASTDHWLLLGGLLVLFLLLFRMGRGMLNASLAIGVGAQLAVAGIIDQAIDLLLFGRVVPIVLLQFPNDLQLSLGTSMVAITAGVALLLYDVVRRRLYPLAPQFPLEGGARYQIDLSDLPRGIDNRHVDLHLSERFSKTVKRLIPAMIDSYIKQAVTLRRTPKFPAQPFATLMKEYEELVRTAVNRQKNSGEHHQVELLHLGLYKFLRSRLEHDLNVTLESNRIELKRRTRDDKMLTSVDKLQRTAEVLADRDAIYLAIFTALCRAIARTDREKNQGYYAQLDEKENPPTCEIFTTPLFHAERPWDSTIMLRHYLLFDVGPSDPFTFARVDTVFTTVFANSVAAIREQGSERIHGTLQSAEALSDFFQVLNRVSVFTEPKNVPILLDTEWTKKACEKAKQRKQGEKIRRLKRHHYYQKVQLAALRNALDSSNLLPQVVAAYRTAELVHDGKVAAAEAVKLKKRLLQRLPSAATARLRRLMERLAPSRSEGIRLNLLRNEIVERSRGELAGLILRFAQDFARYRRDLRFYNNVQMAMADLRLLTNPKDIATSRANHSLNELVMQEEVSEANRVIANHAIVKADLRGSTRLTEELVNMQLNPATHFSNHFFDPINRAIAAFGAEKVFIEGDAIILMLSEYQGGHADHYAVSRACGVAANILTIVAKQNRQLELLHLPKLELGVGIAFSGESPRFIFDGDRRITISPAINRSDRLSACTWSAKQWHREVPPPGHVSFYRPSEKMSHRGDKAEKIVIYNINGIMLEEEGFAKLKKEIALSEIPHQLAEFDDSNFYVGKYPDAQGRFHHLVVREGPVRIYDDSYPPDEAPQLDGELYYEIIYEEAMIQRLLANKVGGAKA